MKNKINAFSLIEIAIGLVVIGLMISGVLKGKDLLENAKLHSIMTQIRQYKLATNSFVGQYGALPGDYNQASENIAEGLANGDNDGIIGGDGFEGETLNYWQHLQKAKLIEDFAKDQKIPTAGLGSSIIITYNPDDNLEGHWFAVIKKKESNKSGAITPKQARNILQKANSPNPISGSVQVRNAQGQKCLKDDNALDMSNKKPSCILYVSME